MIFVYALPRLEMIAQDIQNGKYDRESVREDLQMKIEQIRQNKKIAVLSPVAWRTPPRQYGAWETV
ncbi:MAG: hypothetical protein ACYSOP_04305, partial [Planctomycetota bacterium]